MEPKGTIAFNTVGISSYGFDIFSINLADMTERRHTDGVFVNFNAQFSDEGETVVFVSERTGSARLFQSSSSDPKAKPLRDVEESLFHDRPTIRNGNLYFVSAHEKHPEWFKSWAAVYKVRLDTSEKLRLTPTDTVDLSPAVSRSGELIAVASHGSQTWKGDFRELQTEIVVFKVSDPKQRTVVAERGGWPAWADDSTLFFHRVAEDGWWSVYKVDVNPEMKPSHLPQRITPPGVHAFTPAASHDGRKIAIATRRKNGTQRHIEIYDLDQQKFIPVTEKLNPEIHHYNPFFSPGSNHLGYHRYRGGDADGDSIIPFIQPVRSPVNSLRLLRLYGTFPSFSPDGSLIAINGDFMTIPGLMILRSNGTKKWTVVKDSGCFYTAWSPTEPGVLFTSIGPIFHPSNSTVQIARIEFNPGDLTDDVDEISCNIKILTKSETGNNAFPSCSPDGKHLVFRSGRSGHKNLYIVDAINGEESNSGEGIRKLTSGECIDTMPSWSPKGNLIAFSSNMHNPANQETFSVYLIKPDGSNLRRVNIAGMNLMDRERINHVCFSPCGEWFLFTANLGAMSAETIGFPNQFQPYGDLYVSRLDGSELRRLTCNAYENGTPAWCSGGDDDVLRSLSLQSPAGEKSLGKFDEPMWLTCDL